MTLEACKVEQQYRAVPKVLHLDINYFSGHFQSPYCVIDFSDEDNVVRILSHVHKAYVTKILYLNICHHGKILIEKK